MGQRPSDKKAKRVLGMHADGLSYRLIARNVGMSKNTVMDIVRRNTASAEPADQRSGGADLGRRAERRERWPSEDHGQLAGAGRELWLHAQQLVVRDVCCRP